jgi:hypothetical protein
MKPRPVAEICICQTRGLILYLSVRTTDVSTVWTVCTGNRESVKIGEAEETDIRVQKESLCSETLPPPPPPSYLTTTRLIRCNISTLGSPNWCARWRNLNGVCVESLVQGDCWEPCTGCLFCRVRKQGSFITRTVCISYDITYELLCLGAKTHFCV